MAIRRGRRGHIEGGRKRVGRLGSSLFFALFGSFGLVMLLAVGFQMLGDLEAWAWEERRCTVLDTAVQRLDDETDPYELSVRYAYDVGGVEPAVASDTIRSSDYRDIQLALLRYANGGSATCWVDPEDPGRSSLQRGSLVPLLFLGIPAVFVVVGVVGVAGAWRRASRHGPGRAESARKSTRKTLALVSCLFLAIGLAGSYFLLVRPAWRLIEAQGWPATPCVVEASHLIEHSDSDGTTYRIDILFRYAVDGRTYRSNAYDFVSGSSSGRSGKLAVVRAHPPGAETACYVDPDDPTVAVLSRAFNPTLLFGLIPAVFVLVGGGGLVAAQRQGRARDSVGTRDRSLPSAVAAAGPDAGVLRSAAGRRGRLIIAAVLCVVWNGLVSVLVWTALFEDPSWSLRLFAVPFVTVGVGLIGLVGYMGLAMLNPSVTVALARREVRLGEPFELSWELSGSVSRLDSFSLTLQGEEEASYRHDKKTRTARRTFRTIDVANVGARPELLDARGEAHVVLPIDTMHTWSAPNNRIVWTLKARGRIRRWPDVNDEWTVTLLPAAPAVQGSEDQA